VRKLSFFNWKRLREYLLSRMRTYPSKTVFPFSIRFTDKQKFIGLCMVLALSLLATSSSASSSPHRRCLGNQKTILGALEMYNLDTRLKLVVTGDETLAKLSKEKYLYAVLKCRMAGQNGYRSDKHGNVWCKYHGSIKGREGWIGPGPIPESVLNPPKDTFNRHRRGYLGLYIRYLENIILLPIYLLSKIDLFSIFHSVLCGIISSLASLYLFQLSKR